MKMKGKNFSIALSQLKYEKVRLLVALSGIIFAVVMMFMQLGFSDALFDSSVLLHKSMQADVFLLHSKSSALVALKSFSKYYLYQHKWFEFWLLIDLTQFFVSVYDSANPNSDF